MSWVSKIRARINHSNSVVAVTSGVQPPDLRPGSDVNSRCSTTQQPGGCTLRITKRSRPCLIHEDPTKARSHPQLQHTKESNRRRTMKFDNLQSIRSITPKEEGRQEELQSDKQCNSFNTVPFVSHTRTRPHTHTDTHTHSHNVTLFSFVLLLPEVHGCHIHLEAPLD